MIERFEMTTTRQRLMLGQLRQLNKNVKPAKLDRPTKDTDQL
jgi:hypothetical protein